MVAQQLDDAEAASRPVDVEAIVQEAAKKVWTLADELNTAELARLRELMQRLVDRVDVAFTERHRGKQREYHPTGGRIVFRTESLGFSSRGDWI